MSASVIAGIRFPVAFTFGLLLTTCLFWALWSVTDETFVYTDIVATKVEYTRPVKDLVVETKNPEKVEWVPPVIIDTLPPIETPPGEAVGGVVFTKPPVAVPGPGAVSFGQGTDRDVVPLVRVQPDYPQRAAEAGIEGWVKVQFNISAGGAVTDAFVVESNPANTFDRAALSAVGRWRYNPKIEDAVAVERVGMQTIIRFDLEGE